MAAERRDDDRANQELLFSSGYKFHVAFVDVETNDASEIVVARVRIYGQSLNVLNFAPKLIFENDLLT